MDTKLLLALLVLLVLVVVIGGASATFVKKLQNPFHTGIDLTSDCMSWAEKGCPEDAIPKGLRAAVEKELADPELVMPSMCINKCRSVLADGQVGKIIEDPLDKCES
ncbi:MAG: hypothetical protein ACP5E4_00550 [Candidatus Aenigmatarchaeota archaeon]